MKLPDYQKMTGEIGEIVLRVCRDAAIEERERIITDMESYFALTQIDGSDPNPEWDLGYQAAIAIVRNKS
jgi:hypothetical protein